MVGKTTKTEGNKLLTKCSIDTSIRAEFFNALWKMTLRAPLNGIFVLVKRLETAVTYGSRKTRFNAVSLLQFPLGWYIL